MNHFNLQGIGMTSQRTRNRLVERLRASGIDDEWVLQAIATVPRHIFVDEALAHRAYEDKALPIGHGQTISQPYVVAAMTAAVLASLRQQENAGDNQRHPARVLEIGTGSGYQTAILAMLVERVYSVERIGALLERARRRFRALSIRNVLLKHDDGNLGWLDHAPFDAVVVTAAASHVPAALMSQLADGAPLVIPVGRTGRDEAQQLKLLERAGDEWRQQTLEDVRFVPLQMGTLP